MMNHSMLVRTAELENAIYQLFVSYGRACGEITSIVFIALYG